MPFVSIAPAAITEFSSIGILYRSLFGSTLNKDEGIDAENLTQLALATLDRQMGSEPGMGLILKKALNCIADEFDYVLLDCPPVLGVLMVNALAACHKVIVPVQTEFLALKGLDRMMYTLTMMSRSLNKAFDTIIVPTMFDRRTRAAIQAQARLMTDYSDTVWQGMIPVDTRFRDASLYHLPASVLYPKTRGVGAYQLLLKNLEAGEGS